MTQPMPLTPLQSVMVFESLLNPDSDAYWLAIGYEVPGDWPAEQLSAAWTRAVQANPALRTRFVDAGGTRQVIAADGPALAVCAWSEIRERYPTTGSWLDSELALARRAGSLDTQRVSVLRGYGQDNGAPRVFFAWIGHHVLLDGWSLAQAFNDFFTSLAGVPSLPERPSVAAYHRWVTETGAIERARAYWTRELAGIEPARPLRLQKAATAPGQPTAETTAGEPDLRTFDFRLDGQAASGLASFARRHRVSQAAVVTCLWARLLAAYSEGDDLCVGMTYSSRPAALPDSADMSAMLINTLPLRVDTGRPFVEGCKAVLTSLFAGAEHAHLSYGETVACAGFAGLTRLFHSTVIFGNFAGRLATAGHGLGLPGHPELVAEHGTSSDPLGLSIDLRDDEIVGRLGWDESQFDGTLAQAVVRRLGYWLERLDQLAPPPGTGPGPALMTASEAESWRLTYEQAAEPAPWDLSVLLEGHDPDSVAIRAADGELTYRELTYRELTVAVAEVAGWLREEHQVARGSRVALVGSRGARGAIAILATWAAGAAWCPLDAKAPPGHRRRVLEVLAPDVVLDVADLPAHRGAAADWIEQAPQDTAYFVATSGSTGSPKIVAVTAGGLRPLVTAWRAEYGASPQHVLQLGSWAADVFVGDLLKALATGGSITIVPDDRRTDLDHVIDLICAHHATFLETTPQLMLLLLGRLSARGIQPGQLRTLVAGSDTFREQERAAAVSLLWPQARLVNGYGLSEATIESMVFDCRSAHTCPSGLCPIGMPLGGTAIRIVNAHGVPVPPGAAGELWIGGPQVCAGYLTAEGTDRSRIVAADGIRWLRTGDRAVASASGSIAFLGRADSMVKLRGYRVELGAVEDALLRLEGVREAAVVAADDQLVAFVAGAPGLTPGSVIAHTRAILPREAVPGLVAVLARLPRNANSKIDRTVLASRVSEAEPAGTPAELPEAGPAAGAGGPDSHALTETLIAIWSAVLGRRAHPGQTFFDQGGHSLLALELLDRLQRELPAPSLQIADLFRYPTISALSAELERRGAALPA
jgi:amino acid adenylation domain-containing protein